MDSQTIARAYPQIRDEALRITAYAGRLRAKTRKDPLDRSLTMTLINVADLSKVPLTPRGCANPGGSLSSIYEAGLRFWAEAVARQINSEEWETMVEEAHNKSPEFPGDVIRFFETMFEGLTLKDGSVIIP